jgi:hypothetical protein
MSVATKFRFAATLVAMLSVCSPADAVILFERDLPSNGLNFPPPPNAARSNIAPIQGSTNGSPFVLGDDFTLAAGTAYLVNSITVWIVGNCAVTSIQCTNTNTTPTSEFSNIELFGGLDNGTNGPVSLLSNTYSSTRVFYTGGADYFSETPGVGLSFPLFQLTFSNLGLIIPGGLLYDFAVRGTPTGNNTFRLHASTAAISGGIQQGADNLVLLYQGNPLFVTSGAGAGNLANFANGADINVLVDGKAVATPEPGTIGLLSVGLGMLAFGAYRRRRT